MPGDCFFFLNHGRGWYDLRHDTRSLNHRAERVWSSRQQERCEPWPYHCLAFDNGRIFLSRRQPALYAADASMIATKEIPPGSVVRVQYDEINNVRWMTAVQIVKLPDDQ